MINPTTTPILYNNTLANNRAEGISFVDNGTVSDPNEKDWPEVQNCIVYYNNPGGRQLTGFSANDFAYYSCIQDCNEVNDNHNYNDEPGFAYTVDPNGAPDPNNYHLAYDSFCKDKANPFLTYTGQVDMDGEGTDRKYGDDVDIGADEVYSCNNDLSEDDIYNALDWNADGILNFKEYRYWAASWLSHDPNDPAINDPNHTDYDDLTDPNSPNYIDLNQTAAWLPECNLVDTGDSEYAIDLADLMEFRDNGWWLWTACWKESQMYRFDMMAMAMGGGESAMMTPIPMQPAMMPLEPEPEVPVEPQPEVSPDTLVQIIDFLDEALLDQPENVEAIEDMRAILIDKLQAILEE